MSLVVYIYVLAYQYTKMIHIFAIRIVEKSSNNSSYQVVYSGSKSSGRNLMDPYILYGEKTVIF
jgi:hypothetical protein